MVYIILSVTHCWMLKTYRYLIYFMVCCRCCSIPSGNSRGKFTSCFLMFKLKTDFSITFYYRFLCELSHSISFSRLCNLCETVWFSIRRSIKNRSLHQVHDDKGILREDFRGKSIFIARYRGRSPQPEIIRFNLNLSRTIETGNLDGSNLKNSNESAL